MAGKPDDGKTDDGKTEVSNAEVSQPVPIDKWSNIPKAQSIESIEHIDTSAICDSLGIGHMQPKSPPKPTPFNLFVAKASVPRLQIHLKVRP